MTLTDPRSALADQSSFIGYLLGVSGMAAAVREMATEATQPGEADDFVHLLLGIASLGESIGRLGECVASQVDSPVVSAPAHGRWLR